MTAICQKSLPFAPWMTPASRRMPGVAPVDMADWLQVDDAYAAQMARRIDLLATQRDRVFAMQGSAQDPACELLDTVLERLPGLGFLGPDAVSRDTVTTPDGRKVKIDRDAPMQTLCHLVQEDFCILQQQGAQHMLTGALLCFPASWSLHEKMGQPLLGIHAPVDSYDDTMNRRVERLFAAARAGQPMMRANALIYADPELFHPHRHSDTAREVQRGGYIRSERQSILRLPRTGAVVFSIHTYQIREADLTQAQRAGLKRHPITPSHPETAT